MNSMSDNAMIILLLGKLEEANQRVGALSNRVETMEETLRLETTKLRIAEESNRHLQHSLDEARREAASCRGTLADKDKAIATRILAEIGYDHVVDNRIAAIKKIREITYGGLKETKDIVDAWLTERGWKNPHLSAS